MLKITKRTVDAARPQAGKHFIWDDEIRGFGLKVFVADGVEQSREALAFAEARVADAVKNTAAIRATARAELRAAQTGLIRLTR